MEFKFKQYPIGYFLPSQEIGVDKRNIMCERRTQLANKGYVMCGRRRQLEVIREILCVGVVENWRL